MRKKFTNLSEGGLIDRKGRGTCEESSNNCNLHGYNGVCLNGVKERENLIAPGITMSNVSNPNLLSACHSKIDIDSVGLADAREGILAYRFSDHLHSKLVLKLIIFYRKEWAGDIRKDSVLMYKIHSSTTPNRSVQNSRIGAKHPIY